MSLLVTLGTWTGITQLSIIVDVENAEAVHYVPYAPRRVLPYQEAPQRPNPIGVGDAGPEDQITVYDRAGHAPSTLTWS